MEKLVYDKYLTIRGFNYQPSYGHNGLEIWGDRFDIEIIDKELGQGKSFFPEINTIRLWLSFDAYISDPKSIGEKFGLILDLGTKYGLRFIPTLFNGWRSLPDFGGISATVASWWSDKVRFDNVFRPYIESVVGRFAVDDRIILWDLCNEPFDCAESNESQASMFNWLDMVYQTCKAVGATAPITVGARPVIESIKLLEPISDVITFHPYYALNCFRKTQEEYEANLDQAVAFANSMGKSLVATETGWGDLGDKKRSEILAVELDGLVQRRIGFTAHLLHHTLVADGHRPEYGPITNAGYMAFVEADGSLRPHHDIFNNF